MPYTVLSVKTCPGLLLSQIQMKRVRHFLALFLSGFENESGHLLQCLVQNDGRVRLEGLIY